MKNVISKYFSHFLFLLSFIFCSVNASGTKTEPNNFALKIPGLEQQIELKQGFENSENSWFSPLNPIELGFKNSSEGKKDFKNILVQSYLRNTPAFQKIKNIKVPVEGVFAFQLYKIINDAEKQSAEEFYFKIFKLFFRLTQSKTNIFNGYSNFSDFIKKSKILPKALDENLRINYPQFINVVNSMWKIVADDKFDEISFSKDKNIVSAYGFVFNDEQVANEFYEKFKNHRSENLPGKIKSELGGYELKPYEEYKEDVDVSQKTNIPDPIKKIQSKIVGFQDFGPITGNTFKNTFDSEISEKLSKEKELPKLLKLKSNSNEIWLVCTTTNLSVITTLQILFHDLLKATGEYKQKSKKYTDKYEKSEQYKIDQKRKEFAQTETGKESQKRIDEKIDEVNKEFDLQKPALDEKLKIKKQIKNKKALLGKSSKEVDKINLEIIRQLKERLTKLNKNSEEQKKQLEQYKKDLKYLEKMTNQSEEIKKLIAELKSKIAVLQGEEDTNIGIEKRLQKRKAIAQIYIDEAQELQNAFNKQLQEIEKISDSISRQVAQIKFSGTQELYELQIQHLKDLSQNILQENEQVLVLIELRKELKENLNEKVQESIQDLENSVGYIIDGKNTFAAIVERWFSNQALQKFAKTKEYKEIRSNLLNNLKSTLSKSKLIKQYPELSVYAFEKILSPFAISPQDLIEIN